MIVSSDLPNEIFSLALGDDSNIQPTLKFTGSKLSEYQYLGQNDYESHYTLYKIPFATKPAYLIYNIKQPHNQISFMFYRDIQDLIALKVVNDDFFSSYGFQMDFDTLKKLLDKADIAFEYSLNYFLQHN